jgi:hypothetical protein
MVERPDSLFPLEIVTMTTARVARAQWLLGGALAAVVLIIGSVLASWLRAAPQEQARPDAYILFRLTRASSRGQPAEEDFDAFRQTQAALLKTNLVLSAALRRSDVAALGVVKQQKDPMTWLENSLEVDFRLSPEIMRVSLSGGKPEELATLLNGIASAYREQVINPEWNKKQLRRHELESLQNSVEQRRLSRLQEIRSLAIALGGPQNSLERELVLQELIDCQRELRRARLARAAAEARGGKDKDSSQWDLAAFNAQVNLLTKEMADLLDKIKPLGTGSIDLENLRSEVAREDEAIKQVVKEIQALEIELRTPPRMDVLEDAVIKPGK